MRQNALSTSLQYIPFVKLKNKMSTSLLSILALQENVTQIPSVIEKELAISQPFAPRVTATWPTLLSNSYLSALTF